jgi:hypothetical protein
MIISFRQLMQQPPADSTCQSCGVVLMIISPEWLMQHSCRRYCRNPAMCFNDHQPRMADATVWETIDLGLRSVSMIVSLE